MPVLGTNYFHYVLLVPSHQKPTPLQLFLCNLFGCLSYFGCSYTILMSDLILFLLLPTSTSTPSSHSSLSLLLVFLLLPRSALYIAGLTVVGLLFYRSSPSTSLASSCHTTLHYISSSFSNLELSNTKRILFDNSTLYHIRAHRRFEPTMSRPIFLYLRDASVNV